MALTKVTGQVIKNTTDVTVGVLTVTNTLAVGGTVSIGGTLTYEDVTNVDAVGLITARDGVFISAGSSIGIGSATPTADIEVHTSSNTLGILSSTSNGANFDLFDNDTQSRIRTVDGRLHLYADFHGGVSSGNVADSAIRFFVDGSNERLHINSDGDIFTASDQVRDGARLTLTKNLAGISTAICVHNPNGSGTGSRISSSRALVLSADFDANSGDSSSFISFETDATEKVRITATGKVGIGTASADAILHAYHATDNFIGRFESGDAGSGIVLEDPTHTTSIVSNNGDFTINVDNGGDLGSGESIKFEISGSEKLRIDSDGDLVIAGNSATKNIEYGDGTTTGYFISNTNVNRANAAAAIHSHQFRWNNTKVAEIKVITGDDTTNKDNAHIVFETASAGTTGERLRITQNGDVLIGGTSEITDTQVAINGNIAQYNSGTGTGATVKSFVLSKTYTMSTSGTNVLTFDNWGTSAFDITVFRKDTASPAGAQLVKVYLAFHGSGTNITQATLAQENKVLRGSIHNIDYSITEDNNTATLVATGDDNGGETQTLVFYVLGHGNAGGEITVV